MQQTETYKLNLIDTSDSFSPQPINENMETLETALGGLQSAVDAAVSGSAKIATGSYTGSDTFGKSKPNKLSFAFKPQILLILRSTSALHSTYGASLMLIRPNAAGCVDDNYTVNVTWSDDSVSWYSTDNQIYQMNTDGWTYFYFAIG